MPGSISTSKRAALIALGLVAALASHSAWAQDPPAKDKSPTTEEDDFSNTPYTEYGEFNEETDEANETLFYQHGRFFGVSVGLGYQGVTGNRALLWQGAFPVMDIKVHYWFDFQLALDLGITTAGHSFDFNGNHTDANVFRFGVNVRYSFNTRNVAAPISFANPFVSLGLSSFNKTEVSQSAGGTPDQDSSFGFSFGGGLEFVISPRKTYFLLEAKAHLVTFRDTFTGIYAPEVEDLTGFFYSVTGGVMFTW